MLLLYHLVSYITWLDASLDDLQTKSLRQYYYIFKIKAKRIKNYKLTNYKITKLQEVLYKRAVPKNFAKFTEETSLSESPF